MSPYLIFENHLVLMLNFHVYLLADFLEYFHWNCTEDDDEVAIETAKLSIDHWIFSLDELFQQLDQDCL